MEKTKQRLFDSFSKDQKGTPYPGEVPVVGKMTAVRLYTSASSPTVDNDGFDTAGISQAFEPGDLWNVLGTVSLYKCVDNSRGAADWQKVDDLDPTLTGLAVTDSVDGIMAITLTNNSAASAVVVGVTCRVANDSGYWGGIGMCNSGATILGGALINTFQNYNQGYGDFHFTNDGNVDYVWYSDPTDSHNFSALSNEIMRLKADGSLEGVNFKITPEGGYAVKLLNDTGAPTVKGYLVKASSSTDLAFAYCAGGDVDPLGVVYEAGIADGQPCWVVINGVADVYYSGNVTRGTFSRASTVAEGLAAGIVVNEALPAPPLATDKHFQEIGHPLENRTGAGLAKTIVHFN